MLKTQFSSKVDLSGFGTELFNFPEIPNNIQSNISLFSANIPQVLCELCNHFQIKSPKIWFYFKPAVFVSLQMELKKTILDRMVHLLSRGHVVPIIQYIAKCVEKQDADISLIRHFVTEVCIRC